MKYHVVTTMNEPAWVQYGQKMIASFVKRWPDEALPIVVYAEGFDISNKNVEMRRLPNWIEPFKEYHKLLPNHNGIMQSGYDFRWDGVKFAHKVAAMTHFAAGLKDGIMIWLDADTFTHEKVDCAWLEELFPGKSYIAWLDRVNANIETGFVMFRCDHRSHHLFMNELKELYISGNVFKMKETHDSFVIRELAKKYMALGNIEVPVSLSGDNTWHHPFVNGPLGSRLDHMKGPRKRKGHSDKRDLKAARSEKYWRGIR